MSDRALAGRPDLVCILPQYAGLIGIRWRFPGLAPLGELGLAHFQIECAFFGIDGDRVAIPDQGDWPADRRFGPNMADAEAARPSRESAVGDQGHLVAG